jgi:hypothetical protein
MKKLKVFRINDMEWWAGKSLNQIIDYHKKHLGVDEIEISYAYKLTKRQMTKLKFFSEEDNNYISFQEELRNCRRDKIKSPFSFASRDW